MTESTFEPLLVNSLSDAYKVFFHTDNEGQGMVIFLFREITTLSWYDRFAEFASAQSTFLKFTENENDRIVISFIDPVLDYHISVPEMEYDPSQLTVFKHTISAGRPLLLLIGTLDANSKNPVIFTSYDAWNEPVYIMLGGYIADRALEDACTA